MEEAISVGSWLDALPLVPSILSPEDANLLLQKALGKPDKKKVGRSYQIFANTVLLTSDLLGKARRKCGSKGRGAGGRTLA